MTAYLDSQNAKRSGPCLTSDMDFIGSQGLVGADNTGTMLGNPHISPMIGTLGSPGVSTQPNPFLPPIPPCHVAGYPSHHTIAPTGNLPYPYGVEEACGCGHTAQFGTCSEGTHCLPPHPTSPYQISTIGRQHQFATLGPRMRTQGVQGSLTMPRQRADNSTQWFGTGQSSQPNTCGNAGGSPSPVVDSVVYHELNPVFCPQPQ